MSHEVQQIPLAEIDANSVARDRTHLDEDALAELKGSIVRGGLRQPIEVFELAEPMEGHRYGLISGFRRLRAFRDLAELNPARFATIAAFVRTPETIPAILAAMVEENDVRAGLSAWEKGAVAANAVHAGWFPDLPAALAGLYPGANRQKRARIRATAELALVMDGALEEPERLSERDCLRFAAAVTAGFGDHITASLDGALARGHEAQWAIIEQVIREAEAFPEEHPIRDGRPNRRRITRHRKLATHAIAIRRERTQHGFILHVTGREPSTMLINQVFDEVERWLLPG